MIFLKDKSNKNKKQLTEKEGSEERKGAAVLLLEDEDDGVLRYIHILA